MRLIGIGLLAFILIGAALMLSYLNVWQRGIHQVSNLITGPQLVFETSVPAPSKSRALKVSIYRRDAVNPIIMSGLPAYQNATFGLPIDARPTGGYLQINATFQVLKGVEGALRVSINNTRRGEVLLRTGEAKHSFKIALTPTDLAGQELDVSFSLVGAGSNVGCSAKTNVEASVEIEPSSMLFLTLNSPIESARDRVIASGGTVNVGWPAWLTPKRRSTQLIAAADLVRSNKRVSFIGGTQASALSTVELKSLATASVPTIQEDQKWPMKIAEKGPNSGVRRFYRRTSWRTRYDLKDYAEHEMPSTYDFAMMLGFLEENAHWTVMTTLNGRIVQMDVVPTGQLAFGAVVDLPTEFHDAVNVVEVTASSSSTQTGICNDGPELIAEMLTGTQLMGGGQSFTNGVAELQALMSSHTNVGIPDVPALTPAEAETATALIAAVLPGELKLKNTAQHINFIPFSRAALVDLGAKGINSIPDWLVYNDKDGKAVQAVLASPAAILALKQNPVTGVLVQFSNREVAQVTQ